MLPALVQVGIPGGPELLIIFILMFMFAIPVIGVILVVLYLKSRGSGDEERIEELEREVAELREELGTTSRATDDAGQSNDDVVDSN